MAPSPEKNSVIVLTKPTGSSHARIKVGLSVYSSSVQGAPHFALAARSSVILNATDDCLRRYQSEAEFFLACQLAMVNAVEHFRSHYPERIDYKFTAVEGDRLPEDCTVGFAVAAFLAAVRATGFVPPIEAELHGWKEDR